MKLVESHLTIHDALQQSVSGIMDAMEGLPDKYPCSGEEAAALPSLFFKENEITYRVFYRDLKRMAEMGLEELPVAAIALPKGPDDPDAIGVVLSPDADTGRIPVTHDYSRRLSAYFPVAFVAALYELQSLMTKADIQGYVIGGMPRDLLQFEEKRLEIRDVDITVEGNALEFARFLAENSRNFAVLDEYPEFGTAKIRYKDELMMDLASARQEKYTHCGALPIVTSRGVALANDVIRRDFTLNSLAFSIRPLGQIIDYVNGLEDLKNRQIRVLHPISFFEDPSRILRVMKFCARFDFEPAPETLHLMMQFIRWGDACYKGGGDRIKQELRSFLSVEESLAKSHWIAFFLRGKFYRLINMELNEDLAIPGLERLPGTEGSVESRLVIIGELIPLIGSTLSAYIDESSFSFEAHLCLLLRTWPQEAFEKALYRLGLTRHEREVVESFRAIGENLGQRFDEVHDWSPPAEIYDLFHGVPLMTVVCCLIQLGLRTPGHMRTVLEAFVRYKRKWENLKLELDGKDLIALGISEGKDVGRLLDELLHAKLAGQLPDRLAEVEAVRRRLAMLVPNEALKNGERVINGKQPEDESDIPERHAPPPRDESELYEWEQGAWPDVAPPTS